MFLGFEEKFVLRTCEYGLIGLNLYNLIWLVRRKKNTC